MIIPANPDLCDYLTAKLKRRNKLIKMADRSVLGWDTVTEYEDDPSASDSDDGKKIRQAENRVLTKRKSKKSNKLILQVPTQKPGSTVYNGSRPTPPTHSLPQATKLQICIEQFTQVLSTRKMLAPVAPMLDRGTHASVVEKGGTGGNTTRTPDIETKRLI